MLQIGKYRPFIIVFGRQEILIWMLLESIGAISKIWSFTIFRDIDCLSCECIAVHIDLKDLIDVLNLRLQL